jgi:hypothetical protein
MGQEYSDPTRASDPHALPNIEVFYQEEGDIETEGGETLPEGWYWWSCFPGCLPDGDPIGPFET